MKSRTRQLILNALVQILCSRTYSRAGASGFIAYLPSSPYDLTILQVYYPLMLNKVEARSEINLISVLGSRSEAVSVLASALCKMSYSIITIHSTTMRKNVITRLNRRNFIRNTVIAAAGTALMPTLLTSCDEDELAFEPTGNPGFHEGVASFDPSQNGIILWTRYTPAANEVDPVVILDVATDNGFSSVVASETVTVDSNSDFTVYVDVAGLQSNTTYYYRFRSEVANITSVTGQTKTLPANGEATQVKMAVVSCSNYQAGYFNVYGAIAASDADVVVHMGDYIYEYAAGGYGSVDGVDRDHLPDAECIELDDYRTRYRQYRSDEQLQEVHRLKPFICVWDDHEIANDAYATGAENHQEDEGDFEERKANALQAWHEYLPARVTENSKIYRSFDFGGLAHLMMLDTRIVGRDQQLDYGNYFDAMGNLDAAALAADWLNPDRTILGTEQKTWLMNEIATSTATWQVLGSQVLMGKIQLPAELLTPIAQLAAGNTSDDVLAQYTLLVTELSTIKLRILAGDPTVTAIERARVETVLPYNLDAWDGYPVEREAIFASAAGKNLVTFAGDTHNAWHTNLTDAGANKVGVEFATASVSSPGLEGLFGDDPTVIAGLEQSNVLLIDDLQYVDAAQRGYMMATFTGSEAKAEYNYISTLTAVDATTTLGHTATETL